MLGARLWRGLQMSVGTKSGTLGGCAVALDFAPGPEFDEAQLTWLIRRQLRDWRFCETDFEQSRELELLDYDEVFDALAVAVKTACERVCLEHPEMLSGLRSVHLKRDRRARRVEWEQPVWPWPEETDADETAGELTASGRAWRALFGEQAEGGQDASF